MTLLRRVKNLWKLSAYRLDTTPELLDKRFKTLTKDISTIKKRPVTIIKDDNRNIIEQEIDNGDTTQ